jgi:hypothetical protein
MKNYTSPARVSYTHAASYVFAFLNIWVPTNTSLRADSTLSDDNKRYSGQLTDHYKELQSQIKAQEDKRGSLEKDRISLDAAWADCKNNYWRKLWKTTADEIDKDLSTLDERRKELGSSWIALNDEGSQLELRNININHKFRTKGFKYEQEIHEYLHALNNHLYKLGDIFIPIQDTYIAKFEDYNSLLKFSVESCQKNDLTKAALDTAVDRADHLYEDLKNFKDILQPLKDILKPEAKKTASNRP